MKDEQTPPNTGNNHVLSAVTVCFVPRAVAANTLRNLELVGTTCKYGDKEFRRIERLKCDLHYPAGSFVALDERGNISGLHTWSDIGQLDFAFNDYLNFLMDLRRIYESKGRMEQKLKAIELLGSGTGRQGHAHSFFMAKHGGAESLYAKCAARKR